MRHGVQTVEEARHDDPRRRGLSGKGAQGFRHALRCAAILFHQHPHEAEPFRREGADRLLPPWLRARHQHSGPVEGQDLAEGVVAAHGDDACRLAHQELDLAVEGDGGHALTQRGDAPVETFADRGVEERPERDQAGQGDRGVGLVGGNHPVDQARAVAAAARRDEQERMVGHGGLAPVGPRLRQIAAKVAGVDEPVSDPAGEVRRQGKPGQRLVDAAEPVTQISS